MESGQPVQGLPENQSNTMINPPSGETPPTVIPELPPMTPKKGISVKLILIALVLIAVVGIIGYFGFGYLANRQNTDTQTRATPTPAATTSSDPTAGWEEKKFEKLKLTFKAPPNLLIEESEPSSDQIIAYIQNDKIGEEFFQMYFIYQPTGKKVGEADIDKLKYDLSFIVPGTERNVAIDDHVGFAGQTVGKRSRFVTAIIKDGYWLSIYTAEPNQANKELSEKIMSTFKFSK